MKNLQGFCNLLDKEISDAEPENFSTFWRFQKKKIGHFWTKNLDFSTGHLEISRKISKIPGIEDLQIPGPGIWRFVDRKSVNSLRMNVEVPRYRSWTFLVRFLDKDSREIPRYAIGKICRSSTGNLRNPRQAIISFFFLDRYCNIRDSGDSLTGKLETVGQAIYRFFDSKLDEFSTKTSGDSFIEI